MKTLKNIIMIRPAGISSPSPRKSSCGVLSKHIEELHTNVDQFIQTPGARLVSEFIWEVNSACHGHLSPPNSMPVPAWMTTLIDTLDGCMLSWVDDIPPINQQQRFGNISFRKWIDRVKESSNDIILQMLKGVAVDISNDIILELATYFSASFGDRMRIDYGTGHELTFAAFLCCLQQVGIIGPHLDELRHIALRVFPAYLRVVRRIQLVYWLEPAGSKGVWGLDDYQFLPFMWGSAQLCGHPDWIPSSLKSGKLFLESVELQDNMLYFSAVKFIFSAKSGGSFAEYAPMLYDITNVPSWDKVNAGMIRMYKKEVLNKFPVVQHFLFGKILSFN